MAKQSVRIGFDRKSLLKFDATLKVAMRNVQTGSHKATRKACMDIQAESLKQVPKDTLSLANSSYFAVRRRTDIKSNRYEGVVGYGKGDIVNPKSVKPVTEYMVAVHERLDLTHKVGKAKFLEDPARAYAPKLKYVAKKHIKDALNKL